MYQGFTELLVEKQEQILLLKFNNPKKKNCVNSVAYAEIGRALRLVAKDEDITIVVFTGVGEYFTAGNDLSQSSVSSTDDTSDMETYVRGMNSKFRDMVSAAIDCPKVLLALVNGPAIGIGATLAALCDVVWCSETAYFHTPFTKLGLVPEACSSYLLPLIVGRSRANEMLLFGEKMDAAEAYRCQLVGRVFKLSDLDAVIWPQIREYSKLPPISMQMTKRLIRLPEKEGLFRSLRAECDELLERLGSEEFVTALMNFAMRKSKSKL